MFLMLLFIIMWIASGSFSTVARFNVLFEVIDHAVNAIAIGYLQLSKKCSIVSAL